MKNKTITLTKKNKEGEYILFSGEEKKLFPEVKIHKFQEEKENYLRMVYTLSKKGSLEKESIFETSLNLIKDDSNMLINGKALINVYRTFELINNSNKIPYVKEYLGGGIIGNAFFSGKGISSIYNKYLSNLSANKDVHVIYDFKYGFNYYVLDNSPSAISFLEEIHKKTKIPEKKILEIDKLYPIDDNKEEIKESDLVKIIFS